MQIVKRRKNLGTGTNESYPNHVVVMIFVVVHGGDCDKVQNSLIPLSVSVILLNASV